MQVNTIVPLINKCPARELVKIEARTKTPLDKTGTHWEASTRVYKTCSCRVLYNVFHCQWVCIKRAHWRSLIVWTIVSQCKKKGGGGEGHDKFMIPNIQYIIHKEFLKWFAYNLGISIYQFKPHFCSCRCVYFIY